MSGFAKLRAFLRVLGARYTEDTQPNKPVCTRLAVCRGGTQQASYSELYMYYALVRLVSIHPCCLVTAGCRV